MDIGRLAPRAVQRSMLRRAAQQYAGRGWPVVPGAAFVADRYICGPLCPTVACHPAIDSWEDAASTDSSDVSAWWANIPFSVLLATGRAFDVIEVPASIGAPTARHARFGPIAVMPTGRWMFLVRPGDGLRPELAARLDVVLHAQGSWIPVPPTRTPNGHIRWEIAPATTSWRLPDSYTVQRVLVSHLRPRGRTPTLAATPWPADRVAIS